MNPVVLAGIGFSIAALTLALVAAWGFARSVPAPRYRRSVDRHDGVASYPAQDAAPFPNLLGK